MENLSPEQQLQQLESDYQKRREAIQNGGTETETEHETVSRVAEDQIKQHAPSFQASSHAPTTSSGVLTDEDHAKVQQWVSDSFASSKGVWKAIKEAAGSGDMALLDAFHAALSGELYEQLVARKQIKEVV